MPVGKPFGITNRSSIGFKIVTDKFMASPQVKFLHFDCANFDVIKQALEKIDWSRLFVGKRHSENGMI